jgi:hypothetical protein
LTKITKSTRITEAKANERKTREETTTKRKEGITR